ncbi:MAG: metalloregulator ArsR/SmtB family transcription factor [Gammaproteobacteria bacterium]|nr:metalloregulator ArsR/SmtB family transcription factor [Gammaproteobacteria bacterium]MDH3362742.1 metalloregulator ArsR/SmtB family transcription factor [Gammaproteobacteria bacterium]MDH3481997.1 metalloregulator ArsR/SmtB family transcription factor [Gammaproteobacteria bacterium]
MKASTDKLLKQFKALADPIRVRLVALCGVAECSVSELTAVTGQSQPRISQHLKQLCAADLLERFRDGHFVYYRVPTKGADPLARRRLLALLPADEPQFAKDTERLRTLRTQDDRVNKAGDDRLLHKALVELTVARPLGDLLDIGCGRGRLLKLLASRAHRVVGVDIDPDARRFARAEMLLAGLPNCTLRQGDMFSLPFADAEFDTIILDDVLAGTEQPQIALAEALRVLKSGGRILLLASIRDNSVAELNEQFTEWAASTDMRLAKPRSIPEKKPDWLLAVATPSGRSVAAA